MRRTEPPLASAKGRSFSGVDTHFAIFERIFRPDIDQGRHRRPGSPIEPQFLGRDLARNRPGPADVERDSCALPDGDVTT